MAGLIHVYMGNGKGKTTASVGLSVRARGRGKRVVFAQFLKSGITGELESLESLGVRVIRSAKSFGFTYLMDQQTKDACREEQNQLIRRIQEAEPMDLLVLDEVLDAVNTGMLEEETLRSLVENKEENLELVVTGRDPAAWLMEAADYISDIKKIKHPYDRGIPARIGIEK